MTRGSVIIPSVILVAGARALAMSASSFWAGILRCSGTSPAFTIAGTPKGTASLRFAMRGYNEPNFAPWRIDGPLCPVRAGRLAKRLIGP